MHWAQIFLGADNACPGLFSVRLAVRVAVVHVLTVRAGMGEALQALGTLEGLFAAVQAFVLGQVVFVLERLRTLLALVRSLS